MITKTEFCVLLKVSSGKYEFISSVPEHHRGIINRMATLGYVIMLDDDSFYGPTPEGHHAMETYLEHRRNSHSEAVRYWITTTVAILALITSIISLAVSANWLPIK